MGDAAFALGIGLGVLQAVKRGAPDTVLSVVTLFFYAMPSFWLALLLAWLARKNGRLSLVDGLRSLIARRGKGTRSLPA